MVGVPHRRVELWSDRRQAQPTGVTGADPADQRIDKGAVGLVTEARRDRVAEGDVIGARLPDPRTHTAAQSVDRLVGHQTGGGQGVEVDRHPEHLGRQRPEPAVVPHLGLPGGRVDE